MAGFSTTSGGLNFQYPNRDTTNWDAVMANTFTTLSEHNHDRDTAGKGAALTDRSILADNTGWFQAQDFAGTGTINMIRVNTSDTLELGVATLIPTLTLTNPLAIAQGGHNSTTAAGARTNLGLDTMATQAASAVAITGGTINAAAITNGSATGLTSLTATTTEGGNLRLSGNTLLSTDTDGDTNIDSDGTGEVNLKVGGVTAQNIDTNGIITLPNQSSFHATLAATSSNVTGDGTVVTVPVDTEIEDRNSDFATNTYTAPVTGIVHLSGVVFLGGVGAGHTIRVRIITSNRTYEMYRIDGAGNHVGSFIALPFSTPVDMDAADTAIAQVIVSGGGKTVDILGTAGGGTTSFSGYLQL